MEHDLPKMMRKAVIYYVTGAPEYESLMDDINHIATDRQWSHLEKRLREADLFMAESDIGTLAQKEYAAAKREGRPSRYPIVFDDDATRERKIAELTQEYIRNGIPFAERNEQ